MKVEKLYGFILMALLIVSMAPFALAVDDVQVVPSLDDAAQDVDDVPVVTSLEEAQQVEEELTIMGNQVGSELRYLQLERSILNAIEGQKEVIDYIIEKDSEIDVSELEDIVVTLGDLLGDLQAIDTTVDSVDNIETYAAIREKAKQLITIFRETARELLDLDENDEELAQLKNRVKNLNRNRLYDDLDKQINATKIKYNADLVKELFNRVGINNKPLINAVESGQANYGDIRSSVANTFRNLTEEAKKDAILRAREAKTKYEVQKQALMEKLQAGNMEAARERISARLSNSSGNGSNIDANAQNGGNQ